MAENISTSHWPQCDNVIYTVRPKNRRGTTNFTNLTSKPFAFYSGTCSCYSKTFVWISPFWLLLAASEIQVHWGLSYCFPIVPKLTLLFLQFRGEDIKENSMKKFLLVWIHSPSGRLKEQRSPHIWLMFNFSPAVKTEALFRVLSLARSYL